MTNHKIYILIVEYFNLKISFCYCLFLLLLTTGMMLAASSLMTLLSAASSLITLLSYDIHCFDFWGFNLDYVSVFVIYQKLYIIIYEYISLKYICLFKDVCNYLVLNSVQFLNNVIIISKD